MKYPVDGGYLRTGGEGGIRTLGDVNLIRLAGVRLKPNSATSPHIERVRIIVK